MSAIITTTGTGSLTTVNNYIFPALDSATTSLFGYVQAQYTANNTNITPYFAVLDKYHSATITGFTNASGNAEFSTSSIHNMDDGARVTLNVGGSLDANGLPTGGTSYSARLAVIDADTFQLWTDAGVKLTYVAAGIAGLSSSATVVQIDQLVVSSVTDSFGTALFTITGHGMRVGTPIQLTRTSGDGTYHTPTNSQLYVSSVMDANTVVLAYAANSTALTYNGTSWTGLALLRSTVTLDFYPNSEGTILSHVRRMLLKPLNASSPAPIVYNGPYELRLLQVDTNTDADGSGVLDAHTASRNYVQIGTQHLYVNSTMLLLASTNGLAVPNATDYSTDQSGNAFQHYFLRNGVDSLTLHGQRLTDATISMWDDRPTSGAYANLFNVIVDGSIGGLEVVVLEADSGSSSDILNVLSTTDPNIYTVIGYKAKVTAGGRNINHPVTLIAQDEGTGGVERSVAVSFTMRAQQVPSFSVLGLTSTTKTYNSYAASNATINAFANLQIAGGTPDGSTPTWSTPPSGWAIYSSANANANIQLSFSGPASDSMFQLSNADLAYTEWGRSFDANASGLPLQAYFYDDVSATATLTRSSTSLHSTAPPDIGSTPTATWYTDSTYLVDNTNLIAAAVTVTGGLPDFSANAFANLVVGSSTATNVLLNNTISGSSRSIASNVQYNNSKTYAGGATVTSALNTLAAGNVAYGTMNFYFGAVTDGLTAPGSAAISRTETMYVFAPLTSVFTTTNYDLNTADAAGTEMINYTSLFKGGVRFSASNGIITTFTDPNGNFWSESNGSVMVPNTCGDVATVQLSSFVFKEAQRVSLSDTTYRQVSATSQVANAYFYTVPTIAPVETTVYLNLNIIAASQHANGGLFDGKYYWDVPWTYAGGHTLLPTYSVNTVYGGSEDVANGADPNVSTYRQAPTITSTADLTYYNLAFFDVGESSFIRITILLSDPTALIALEPAKNSFTLHSTFASYAPHSTTLWSSTDSSTQTLTFELLGFGIGAFTDPILTNYIDTVGDDASASYAAPGTAVMSNTQSVGFYSDGINNGDGAVFRFVANSAGLIPTSMLVTDTVSANILANVDIGMSGTATMTVSANSDGVTGSLVTFTGLWDNYSVLMTPNSAVTLGNASAVYYAKLVGGVSGNAAEGGNLINATTAALRATNSALNTSGGQDPRQTYYFVGTMPVSGLADTTEYAVTAQRLGGAGTDFALGTLVYGAAAGGSGGDALSGASALINFVKNARYTVSNVTSAGGAAKWYVASHPFVANDQVLLTQDAVYGSSFYYVKTVVDGNTFTLSTTVAGSNVVYSANSGGYVARVLGSDGFVLREGNASLPNAKYGLCANGWSVISSGGKVLLTHSEKHGLANGAQVQVYGTDVANFNGQWQANVVSDTSIKIINDEGTEVDFELGFNATTARVSIGVAVLHDAATSDGDRFVLQLCDQHGLATDLSAARTASERRMETRTVGRLWDFTLAKDYNNSWLDCLTLNIASSSVSFYDANGVGTVDPNTANIQYVLEARAANGFQGANANEWVVIGCGHANLVQLNANVLIQLPERALANVLHYSSTAVGYYSADKAVSYRLHARNGAVAASGNGITASDYVTRTVAGSTRRGLMTGSGLTGLFHEGIGNRRVLNDVCLDAGNGGPVDSSGGITNANALILDAAIEGQHFPQVSTGNASVNIWGFTDLVATTQPPLSVNVYSNGARFIDPLT